MIKSFFNRYLYNTFDKAEKKSISQTSGEKSVKLKNGKKLILKIWDICACDSFESNSKFFYKIQCKQTNGIIFLYDMSSLNSFQELKKFVYS